ncbi:MAG: cytochrome c [Bacteriovoracaceae bacterium]|nr:cytochrome c [Bacteriovoracaceae bacterium]
MMLQKSKWFLCVFTLILVSFNSFGFDPAQVFEKKCSSCHTVGGGDDVGPDLKGVSKRKDKAWLIRFIKESQAVIGEGDEYAIKLFNKYRKKKMPDQTYSDDEIADLLSFIENGGAGLAAAKKVKSALNAKTWEIDRGEQLFVGTLAFEKGGPACLSCHSAGSAGFLGGGLLGPDLTHTYSSYNDKGVSKVLTRISFPIMDEVYRGKALTEDEVYQLKSFLFKSDREGEKISSLGYTKKFIFLGVVGLLLALGVVDLIWRDRRKKTRRPV